MPVRNNLYIHKGETRVEQLAQADWAIPNAYCAPYFFGFAMTSTEP